MTDSDNGFPSEILRPSTKESLRVYLEYCVNCESHQWCTNHKSDKYKNYVAQVKSAINSQIPECTIIENDLPKEKSDRLIKTHDKQNGDLVLKYKSKKGHKS